MPNPEPKFESQPTPPADPVHNQKSLKRIISILLVSVAVFFLGYAVGLEQSAKRVRVSITEGEAAKTVRGGGTGVGPEAISITSTAKYLGNPERCGIPTNPSDQECTPGIPLDVEPLNPDCHSCRNPIVMVAARGYRIVFGFGPGNYMSGTHSSSYYQISYNAETGKFKFHRMFDTDYGTYRTTGNYFTSAIRDFPDKTLIAGGDMYAAHDGENYNAIYTWDHSSNQWLTQPWVQHSSEMTDITEFDGKIFSIGNIDEIQHGDERSITVDYAYSSMPAVRYSTDNGRTWIEVWDEYDSMDPYRVLRGKSFLHIGSDLYLATDQDTSPWYKYKGFTQTADGGHRVAFEPVTATAPVTYQGSRAIQCGSNTAYFAGKAWKNGTFGWTTPSDISLYVGTDLNSMRKVVLPVSSRSEYLDDLAVLNTPTGQECAVITHAQVTGVGYRSYIYVSSDGGTTWKQRYYFDNSGAYIMSAASLGGDLYFGLGNVAGGQVSIGNIYRYHVADVPTPTPVCTRANPSIWVSPPSAQADSTKQKAYDVYITNNDRNCPPSTFSLTSRLPSGIAQTPALQTMILSQDESILKTITIDGTAAVTKLNDFTETITNVDVPNYSASVTAKFISYGGGVCPYPAPTVAILPIRSTSGTAGQRLYYFSKITNNNPLYCGKSGYTISQVGVRSGWSVTPDFSQGVWPGDTRPYGLVGGVVNFPFSITSPSSAQPGTYQITFKITDNYCITTGKCQGSTTVEVPYIVLPGKPPTVTITAPVDGVTVTSGKIVTITATASSSYPIQKIAIYENGRLLGTCADTAICKVKFKAYWYGSKHIIVASAIDTSPDGQQALGSKEITVHVR